MFHQAKLSPVTLKIFCGTLNFPPAAPPVHLTGMTVWSFQQNSSASCAAPGPPAMQQTLVCNPDKVLPLEQCSEFCHNNKLGHFSKPNTATWEPLYQCYQSPMPWYKLTFHQNADITDMCHYGFTFPDAVTTKLCFAIGHHIEGLVFVLMALSATILKNVFTHFLLCLDYHDNQPTGNTVQLPQHRNIHAPSGKHNPIFKICPRPAIRYLRK